MSYTTQNTTQQVTPTKDNRKLIYGLLISALLITWGIVIYDKSKSKETVQQLQTQVINADNGRTAIQQEFNVASAKLDSLTGSNIKLQGALAERNAETQKLKNNISSILKNKNATAAELAKARTMIAELNSKTNEMLAQIEQLKKENTELTETNTNLNTEKTKLTTEKTILQDNLVKTTEEKLKVEDVASTLHVSNINIAAINVKGNGKEKETSIAKRADLMRVSFQLDENRVAPSGKKELFVIVTAPDGTPLNKGEKIVTREEGDKNYTNKVLVDYEQGKTSVVSFDWKADDAKYQQGDYKIEIYQNGYKIGESVKSLKKGGLFS
jgi:predicted nuclease with TOPRIM domain